MSRALRPRFPACPEDTPSLSFYISCTQISGFWLPGTGCVTLGRDPPVSGPPASRRPPWGKGHCLWGAPLACRATAALWPLELVKSQDRCTGRACRAPPPIPGGSFSPSHPRLLLGPGPERPVSFPVGMLCSFNYLISGFRAPCLSLEQAEDESSCPRWKFAFGGDCDWGPCKRPGEAGVPVLTVPECPGTSVSPPVHRGPFCPDQRVMQLMTLEPNRSFSAVEGRKGILGRGNSMGRVRRLRVQRSKAQMLEPMGLPLICCVKWASCFPFWVSVPSRVQWAEQQCRAESTFGGL